MDRFKEAVTAYEAALEERIRHRVRLEWAMTQNNLGVALQKLGERESGTEQLSNHDERHERLESPPPWSQRSLRRRSALDAMLARWRCAALASVRGR